MLRRRNHLRIGDLQRVLPPEGQWLRSISTRFPTPPLPALLHLGGGGNQSEFVAMSQCTKERIAQVGPVDDNGGRANSSAIIDG